MLPPAVDRAAVSRSFVGKLETGATAGADEKKLKFARSSNWRREYFRALLDSL
jgi:hypothetical protein